MKRHAVPWVGGLLIAAIVAMAGYDIVQSYHAAVRDTGRELETQASMIAEQTARSFQAVDVHLRQLVRQHDAGAFAALEREQLRAFLREQAAGLVQAEGLAVIGPDGGVLASSYLPAPLEAQISVAAQPGFLDVRADRNAGFYVGNAVRTTSDGRWMIPMVRRLETRSGDFAGMVAARGRIEYFQDFYRDLRLDEGTQVSLVKDNGTLLARHPPAEAALGQPHADPGEAGGRLGARQPVPGYPLSVRVTREAGVALAPWRQQSLGTAGRTLALSVLAALLLALLARQISQLYAARERFALAVAGSDDGIWEHDYLARRAFNSARAQQLVGLPPGPESLPLDQLLETLPRHLHPDDVARRAAAMQAHLEGRAPIYEVDLRHRQADGSYRWVRVRGLCVRDAAGRPVRMAGSVSDIDARKRVEEALRESQERFELAVAGSNDGIVDWDVVNDRMYSSRRAMEIVGIDSDVTVRTRAQWRDLVVYHPDDVPRMKAELEDFLAGRIETRDGEYRVRMPDGRYRWIRHRNICVRDADGRPLRVAGSVSDIDAQKRAEEALRESEEQYRAIFNAAADALVLRDAEARIVDVNPALLQMSGYTREELLNETHWIFAGPRNADLARDTFARVSRGERVQFEATATRKDGTPIDVEVRGVPILYRGRAHSLGMVRDITAQKRAEAQRRKLEGQLLQAKKLEAIGTLAGGIAHDFNNILAAILGFGEMAQKGAPQGSALRRHVDAVVSAGMRAKSLVARILAFSRAGVGERMPVHVQSVVGEALELVAASLQPGITLERSLRAHDAAVSGDATQIHQVVMNLCANAAQAMKSGGRLGVLLDVVDKGGSMAATSALAAGRYVRLQVSDTGMGIPAGVMDRIFDPFFTTKGVGVGTGLGLSLVHGIVTDLGGGIDVDSREGAGATFTVYLPSSDAPAAAPDADEAVPLGEGQAVLLVDDEEALVRLGEEVIAGLGYEPVGFTSSGAALEAVRAAPARFSAVLSDQSMPEMTGVELAREIRRIRPDLPVLLVTGFISPALAAAAREAGVAEVLAKPLVSRDIARSLAGALRGMSEAG